MIVEEQQTRSGHNEAAELKTLMLTVRASLQPSGRPLMSPMFPRCFHGSQVDSWKAVRWIIPDLH